MAKKRKGRVHDITIRVAARQKLSVDSIRKAVWRHAHGHETDTIAIDGIDWRTNDKTTTYPDSPDVWENLVRLLRSVGWKGFRIARVKK